MNKHYIDWFIKKSQRAMDLLSLDLFPDGKEITEQYAFLNCCLSRLKINPKDEKVLFVSIGDGVKPRGACTIAYNTLWNTASIDPKLEKEKYEKLLTEKGTKRVHLIKSFFDSEENKGIQVEFDKHDEHTIILAFIHSHASLNLVLKYSTFREDQKVWLVSMPCCNKDNLDLPYVSYKDDGVWSPKNQINIYAIKNCKLNEINI